jgi:hypothetical protein
MFTPTLLFSGQLKTSNVGSILAGVSMECILWTNAITTSTSGSGKNSSSESNRQSDRECPGPLNANLHTVDVWAEGSVDCRDNGRNVIACPSGTLAGFSTSTKVGIGKASLVLQEENHTKLK